MYPHFKINKLSSRLAFLCSMSVALPVVAADTESSNPISMDTVVVTATRVEQNSFDLPMSIDANDAEQIQEARLKVNLSESSARVPGVVVNNRNNPAQDLAIQIRGFGARSAFGVRGVRLYADGIPMSMPDGQGQTGTFNLDTASQVEYLRGPFSALYGNSSGGVVQIFTQNGSEKPTLSGETVLGSYHTQRESLGFSGTGENFDYVGNASNYRTYGERDHSATQRETAHVKLNFKIDKDTKLSLIATSLDQPNAQDPQGLTAQQYKENRKQVSQGVIDFNTRSTKNHVQAGASLEHKFTSSDSMRLMAYFGQRDNESYLSTSIAAQTSSPGFAKNGGGVSVIDRDFSGIDARWTHKGQLANQPFNLTAGLSYDLMKDNRKGYENFVGGTGTVCGVAGRVCGVKGQLRRNETNDATSFDQYAQASWDIHPRWSMSGGIRHSRVSFKTKDSYITENNSDDSGSVNFSETTPVLGTVFKLTDRINLFANAGDSFETPTFIEMGYNPDTTKSGLNFNLKPAKSRQYEIGAKARLGAATLVNLAMFKINTHNEIVVASSQNGRTTYQNVPSSERKGLELSVDSQLPRGINLYLAYTLLDAKFTEAFRACKTGLAFGTCNYTNPAHFETIAIGGDIPGTYRHNLYGEASWKHQPTGFSTALEMRKNSDTYVSFNTADGKADGYTVFNWRGGFSQKFNHWKFTEFVRIDNIFNKDYVGAVRVADSNKNFYEAASGRNWFLGVNLAYQF